MRNFLTLISIISLLNFVDTQVGVFGCMSSLNTDIDCPVQRTLEITIFMGNDNGANSDNIDITASFYDPKKNLIAAIPLKWPNCNPYEKGNVQTFKACGNWVQIAKTVSFTVQKSDEMQVEALTVALGERTGVQNNFWFDDVIVGSYSGMPVFNKLELTPICPAA